MNKLKVNKNIFKKGSLVLVTIALGTSLVLSGCSTFNQGIKNDYVQNKNYIQNTEISYITKDSAPMKTISTKSKVETPINFSYNNYLNVQNYIKNSKVNYEYEQLYNFDDALNEYNNLVLIDNHNIKVENITGEAIYEQVLKNNEEFKRKNTTSIYKILDSSNLNSICNLIATTVNDYLEENASISEDRIKCVLSDLKIFEHRSSVSNAYVTTDNCFMISPNMLEIAQMINGKDTDDDIFIHEIIHLLQKGCNCDLELNSNLERNYGFGYKFNNLDVNSLDFTWIYEAAAEKNMINYTGHDALVYKNKIGYLESLSMVNILNDSYNVHDTEKLSFKRNLDDLYNLFNASSEEEKKEVLNLMYSIEIMQSQPEDFYEIYENKFMMKKDGNLVDDINYTLKPSICLSLSRFFYKNLAQNIINKEITIEDIFFLISLFENDLNNHILYNDRSKIEYNKVFLEGYVELQSQFFTEIAISMNVTVDDVFDLFLNYGALIKEDEKIQNNCSLKFISDEKIEYLMERQNTLYDSADAFVYSTYNALKNNKIY